ncbi:hypothetical protein [Thermococcus sibiricus]|uniref:MATH domain-containing protein n=1 Tax=Thermococcus sibiricus (strain DSM 12597 / MM 739) TaxID=604354 RepID=C6A3J4_THESM|nr:hypothetical protein [Thermococcus sibiricus]ACS90189.1 hypothetical protein TSIB_1135 [Thermococcus sibiricus MM 739]
MWREKLRQGFLENDKIMIELSIGGECGEWFPSLALYDKGKDMWYYFDNDILPGATEEEALENAIRFFEKLIIGLEKPKIKSSPLKEAPEEVYTKLRELLEELKNEDKG